MKYLALICGCGEATMVAGSSALAREPQRELIIAANKINLVSIQGLLYAQYTYTNRYSYETQLCPKPHISASKSRSEKLYDARISQQLRSENTIFQCTIQSGVQLAYKLISIIIKLSENIKNASIMDHVCNVHIHELVLSKRRSRFCLYIMCECLCVILCYYHLSVLYTI